MASHQLVQLKQAKIGYPGTTIFEKLDLSINPGDFLAIVGPNGSGKTTLLRAILGLSPLLAGERILFGKLDPKLDQFKGDIAYVPQKMSLNQSIPLSVFEFLSLKGTEKHGKEEILEVLKKIELQDKAQVNLRELSGGQLQRVFVAFALLGSAKLICLDEATEGMDLQSEGKFLDFLKGYVKAQTRALIYISHDISAVTEHTNRVICLNREILFDGSPSSPQFHSCLHKIYGESGHIHSHQGGHHDH